jgi:HEAT repeat protein
VTSGLPTPATRLSPRALLALLEAHVGGAAGRSLLEDGTSWKPYWARVWAARGLLYVWDDRAAPAVLDGLADEHWRVAEMCLKVSARRELPCGEDGVRLAAHELARVRAAAARALGVAGDTEHVAVVRDLSDDPADDVRRAASRALEMMEVRLDLGGHDRTPYE